MMKCKRGSPGFPIARKGNPRGNPTEGLASIPFLPFVVGGILGVPLLGAKLLRKK